MFTDQNSFDVRCEWAVEGVHALAPHCDAVVIVDVLSFTTCVEVACSRGATVRPCLWDEPMANELAKHRHAILAGPRSAGGFSLSPASLQVVTPGVCLMLPSLNGAALTFETFGVPTVAACLRNARAVAEYVQTLGPRIAVVPSGERWPDGGLRPALEDLLGAGSVIRHLEGSRSPEAAAAELVFDGLYGGLRKAVRECASGRELIERGFEKDVEIASDLDCSGIVPILEAGRVFAARV